MGSIYGWIFTSFLPPLFHYIYHYHPLEIFVRAFFFFSGIDLWHAKGYALRVLKKKKHWKGLVWVLSGCVKYQVGKGGGVCVAKFSFLSGEKKKEKKKSQHSKRHLVNMIFVGNAWFFVLASHAGLWWDQFCFVFLSYVCTFFFAFFFFVFFFFIYAWGELCIGCDVM